MPIFTSELEKLLHFVSLMTSEPLTLLKQLLLCKINQKYEGHSESSNNCLIIQLIFIVKQKETYLI